MTKTHSETAKEHDLKQSVRKIRIWYALFWISALAIIVTLVITSI